MYSTFDKNDDASESSRNVRVSHSEKSNDESSIGTNSEVDTQNGFTSLKSLFGGRNSTWSPPAYFSSPSQSEKTQYVVDNPSIMANGNKSVRPPTSTSVLSESKQTESSDVTSQNITPEEDLRGDAEHLDMPYPNPFTEEPNSVDSEAATIRGRKGGRKSRVRSSPRIKQVNTPQTQEENSPPTEEVSQPRIVRYSIRKPSSARVKRILGLMASRGPPLPPWRIGESSGQATADATKQTARSVETSSAQRATTPLTQDMDDMDGILDEPIDETVAASFGRSNTAPNPPVSTSSSSSSPSPTLTHLNPKGEAHMVDVGLKSSTPRFARACGIVRFTNPTAYSLITTNTNKKGDVLSVSRIAGIMAAKKCSDIVPLCHPIPLTSIQVSVTAVPAGKNPAVNKHSHKVSIANDFGHVYVSADVETRGQTGVEMEALTAVMGACLSVYDMCKAVDKAMDIVGVHLVEKTGGKEDFVYQKWRKSEEERTAGHGKDKGEGNGGTKT